LVFPKLHHYFYEEDYSKEYTFKPHIRIHMGMEPIRLGETFRAVATFHDEYGSLETPDSAPTISIYDPDATIKVTTQTMSRDSNYTSTYYYEYDITSSQKAGLWRFVISATMTINGEYDMVESGSFEVYKQLG